MIRALQAVDYVDCVNGTVASNTSKSYAEACSDQGLNCCIQGGQVAACGGFTGKVHNNSCNGQNLPNCRACVGSDARPALPPLPRRISSAQRAPSCGCRWQCRATIQVRRCNIRGRRRPRRLNAGPVARMNAAPYGLPPCPLCVIVQRLLVARVPKRLRRKASLDVIHHPFAEECGNVRLPLASFQRRCALAKC